MEHVLAEFYHMSRQRVNQCKLRIWFSPNTLGYLRHSICLEFGVLPTLELVTYLGVPLIHGRSTVMNYNYLLDRARQRLIGWKVNTLFRAASTILISTSLSALPSYTIQTPRVPKTVLLGLEKLCRKFFFFFFFRVIWKAPVNCTLLSRIDYACQRLRGDLDYHNWTRLTRHY